MLHQEQYDAARTSNEMPAIATTSGGFKPSHSLGPGGRSAAAELVVVAELVSTGPD
jgi:hypothetical protein